MADLLLPRPKPHQLETHASPARYKVCRWGRRSGKSRWCYIAGVSGHGPGWPKNPEHPGLLQGWDIVWVAPDFPQARMIWREEIEPRFEPLEAEGKCKLNKSERTVTLANGAVLEIISSENIRTVRGKGSRLGGVIVDEGAHFDLEAAWLDVLVPALADNRAWVVFNSTTNAGLDGNAQHLTPSFFNRLCNEVMSGARGPNWHHSYRIGSDNPVISPQAFQEMVDEYPAESPRLAQEVYAKLIVGGAGLAFPEWAAPHHTFTGEVNPSWKWFAGLDWGYTSPGCFVLMASGPDREILMAAEHYFKGRTPYDVGCTIGSMLLYKGYGACEFIAGDSAMWAVTDGGECVAEGVQRGISETMGTERHAALVSTPKGAGSRVAGKMLVHEALKYDRKNVKADGTLAPYHMPRLRVHTRCANVIRTLPALPLDPKNPEDVDTEADDHAYDAARYALVLRQPETPDGQFRPYSQDMSPGYHEDMTRKRPHQPGWDERHARELALAKPGAGFQSGMRWSDDEPFDG